jgi:hypothetical protein
MIVAAVLCFILCQFICSFATSETESKEEFNKLIQNSLDNLNNIKSLLKNSVLSLNKDDFDNQKRLFTKELNDITRMIDLLQPIATIAPAFQYAQSLSEVLLNIKFSHKIDAPATLNVEPLNVTLTNEGKLYLLASDGARKNFKLDLDLYDEILPSESTYALASVGKFTFTIKKAKSPSKWPRLTKSTQKIPNLHIWWEMAEKYEEDFELYEKTIKKNKNNTIDTTNNNTTDTNAINSTASSNSTTITNSTDVTSNSTELNKQYDEDVEEDETEHNKLKNEIIENYNKKIEELEDELDKKKKMLEAKYRDEKRLLDTEYSSKKQALEKEKENSIINIQFKTEL